MRKKRELREGACYHVVLKTGSGGPWVEAGRHDGILLGILLRAKAKYPFVLEGYAIMDNRLDLVIRPLAGGSLPVIMRWIAGVFAAACNREGGMEGHVWAGPFRSEILGDAPDRGHGGSGTPPCCVAEPGPQALMTSARTPAAVTSAPAPGPRTTSGRSA